MIKPEPSSSLPRFIRHSNMVAALQALFDHGKLSRADLARLLGLNRSSSGNIIAELLATSLVREVPLKDQEDGGAPRAAGRPGIALELKPEAAWFLGVEIGVEHITTLRMNLRGQVSDCRIEPFDGRSVPAKLAVERAIAQAFAGLSEETRELVEGFGLGLLPGGNAGHAPLRDGRIEQGENRQKYEKQKCASLHDISLVDCCPLPCQPAA